MSELTQYTKNFVAVSAFDAVYRTARGEQHLVLESRTKADGSTLLFTVIDHQPIRASSVYDFVVKQPECLSLSIPHTVRLLWNRRSTLASLIEVFIPTPDASEPVALQLRLSIETVTYETEPCPSLTNAMRELGDLIGSSVEWWIQSCYDCMYSYPAFPGPGGDRDDLRCYRDAPEAFAAVEQHGKFAPLSALFAGHYFVHAFHTCAAWQQHRVLQRTEDERSSTS